MSPIDQGPTDSGPEFKAIALSGPPLESEFKPGHSTEAFQQEALSLGRCFGSKSGYRRMHKRCIFIPNANVFCQRYGKIWWGDVDLAVDKPALERVSRKLRCRLYILREDDGRWENAELPFEEVVCRARWHTGGPRRVPHLRRFLRNSGLRIGQLGTLIGVSSRRLNQRHGPETGLEIYRRLVRLDQAFAQATANLGLKRWGMWWTSPNEKLDGKSPLVVLKEGGTLEMEELLGPEAAFHFFGLIIMMSQRI